MNPVLPADDPTLVALAVDRISSALQTDEQPQLKLDNYVYQGSVVHCDRYIYLPQSILSQFERLECKSFSGILPEINRIYITIDNRLILFNYIDGSIYVYEDFNQIIISVALVTPKPDVFIDEIEYLLAVATPADIVILGVRFDGGPQTGSIELVETSYYACSDGIHMLKLVCTPYPSSRIFAAGKDGRVYEIDYQPGTRWFAKKCRKLSHMSLMDKVSILFPVLKLFQSSDPLIDLVVDPRKVQANLYGLTQGSSIYKYELGQDKYDQCRGPFAIDASRLQSSLGLGVDSEFSIVALSVDHGFSGVDVCAISNNGHRIYLKSNAGDDFVIDSVRICPRYIDAPSSEGIREKYKPFFSKGQSPCAVKNAIYFDGVFVAADMRDPRFDTLVSMTVIEPGDKQSITTTTSSSATPTVQSLVVSDENVESHLLDCRVHDMKTVPRALLLQQTPLASTLYRNAQATQPLLGLSSAAIQHAVPPPRFIVLTASRVMFYGISRPLEQLTQLLSSNCSAATLQAAMSKLGMAESCAMLLTIICSSTMPVASDKRSVPGRSPEPYTVHERRTDSKIEDFSSAVFSQNQVVRQAAIDAFMSFGGEPTLKLNSLDNNISFSHAHSGLYMYASRVIRSVWFRSLVEHEQRELVFRLPKSIISSVLRPLSQLHRFINEYQIPQTRLFQSHSVASGTLELNSISALEKFLGNAIEILNLVLLIQQTETLSQIAQTMDSGDRFVLETNPFKDLLTMDQGTRCIKGLIRTFMEVEGPGGSTYISTLQSLCPSYIDSTDLFLFSGNQLLSESSNQSFQGKSVKLQREAIESFKKASANIDFPLQNVTPKLMEKGLLSDVIELCLWRASSLDRYISSSSTSTEEDRVRRQTVSIKQKNTYQAACSCLDDALSNPASNISQQQISAALSICFQSSCLTFLNDYFFPFYVQKCNANYDVACDNFQNYLVQNRLFDRLRQYFVTLHKFTDGAKFFAHLPFNLELTGNHITIRDRIRYLEIAIELNRYCTTSNDNLTFELRKAIELGEIQSQLISHLMSEKGKLNEQGIANSTTVSLDSDLSLCMSSLLNGEKLYNISCRYGQYETCLKILFVEDSRQHGDVVAALYANIISSIIKERESLSADWRLAVKETISRLGRQYRLSTFMFPASLICELLEQYNVTRSLTASQAAPFVGPLMLDQVDYPVDQLIAIYSHLIRHWTLSRDGVYSSILYVLSPSHIDALSSNTLLYQKTISSAIALCDLCLSLPDNSYTDQFNRLRQLYVQKKASAS